MSFRVLPLFPAKFARLNWISINPQSASRATRFVFGARIEFAIFRRLLPFVLLVMPGHSRFDLFKVDVFSIQKDFSNQSTVLIHLVIDDGDVLVEDHVRETFL